MNNLSQKKQGDQNEVVMEEIRVLEVGDYDKNAELHADLNEENDNGVFDNDEKEVSANTDQNNCIYVNNSENLDSPIHDDIVDCDTNNDKVNDSSNGDNVKKDDIPKNINYIPTVITHAGNEVVVFDEMLVQKGSERWSLTVCGQFVGYTMHINELRDDKGLNVVFDKGPWMIVNVPLEALCLDGISALASSLGRPTLMDTMAASMCHNGVGNLEYARVLVEMDAKKEFKKEIKIQYRDKENNKRTRTEEEINKINKKKKEVQYKKVGVNDEFKFPRKRKNNESHFNNTGTLKQNNNPTRKNVNENKNQVYTEKQANNNDQAKNDGNNTEVRKQWPLKTKEYNAMKHTSNKYFVIDTLPEDNVIEMTVMKDRMIFDQFLNKKLQPSATEASSWSQDMIRYFKEKWEEDRRKEKEEGNGNLEDVLENTSTATQGMERRQLWKDFVTVNRIVANHPWIMFGDFNVTLNTSEHSAGGSLEQLIRMNLMTALTAWKWRMYAVQFHPYVTLDNCPICIALPSVLKKKIKAFRFANYIADKPEFLDIMAKEWNQCFPIDDAATLFTNKVTSDEAEYMIRDVSDNEIKEAMFDIRDCKAPRPNGYSSTFFKKAWTVVGNEIDIAKAYDTVDWSFLKNILNQFVFHKRMVKWIMTCVSTTAFTVNISREMHGYFKGGTGLRQGDPLSPYLFTLVMEVFTLIIARKVKECKDFKYYFGCKDLSLTHMCFANDLLVICHGDVKSVKDIDKVLKGFLRSQGDINKRECKDCLERGKRHWVKWVHVVKLKGRSFWDIDHDTNDSWSWKDAGGSLSSIITRRDVYDARLKDNTTVVRMIDNNCWSWPNGWCDRYPMLNNIHVPLLKANEDDKVQWVKGNRESSNLSVKLRIMYGWIGGVIAVMCHGGMLFGSLKTTQVCICYRVIEFDCDMIEIASTLSNLIRLCGFRLLADAGSETRPPMLERGSYIPWASRFLRYIKRKRDTRKFLKCSIEKGPYKMKEIPAIDTADARPQTEDDLTGYDLK
ncbi:RNA-directed DNA polymerase, eukaryota, reverse transcriptase zinc-binding domain protein [Tanacetum coccineum]